MNRYQRPKGRHLVKRVTVTIYLPPGFKPEKQVLVTRAPHGRHFLEKHVQKILEGYASELEKNHPDVRWQLIQLASSQDFVIRPSTDKE